MKKRLIYGSALMGVLIIIFLSGPKPATPLLDPRLQYKQEEPTELEQEILKSESQVKNLKPDNESRIVWADSINKTKTPWCIVYLHGFSASPQEGKPVHRDIAKKYGCNLYIPRLYVHGLNEQEPMLEFNEEDYLNSAKQAVAEAKCLGEKTIIMGTSTGGTLGLYIASGNPDIAALILYSPNIDLFDSKSFLLTQPWGLQIARTVLGGKYFCSTNSPPGTERYWTQKYRLEALVRLKNLVQNTMKKEVFEKVSQPVLMCYYYKNEREQDSIVSVAAMLKMYDELATDTSLKRKASIPNAGKHAISSGMYSHDVAKVEQETQLFLEDVMHLKPLY